MALYGVTVAMHMVISLPPFEAGSMEEAEITARQMMDTELDLAQNPDYWAENEDDGEQPFEIVSIHSVQAHAQELSGVGD